jgi:hypothetical protein
MKELIFCGVCGGSAYEPDILHRASDNLRMYEIECSCCHFRGGIHADRAVAISEFLRRSKEERRRIDEEKQSGDLI